MKVVWYLALLAGAGACHRISATPDESCSARPRVVRATLVERTHEVGIIQGTVADTATSRGLPYAVAWVVGAPSKARTDSSGAFRLPLAPDHPSSIRLVVAALGYERHIDTLRLPADSGLALRIFSAYDQICLEPMTVGVR